ncbi:inactive glucose-1-phosphate adenylyltransferase small subunit 2, chloroplastic [Typha angustifolia]|uniref:inactive glucose-1-phosphate adenylyltransferase small subunit 2, chloroplastic n=1 Tax=Typha angustifolia TaxID=59011 RepID=UPI003C2D7976
MQSVLAIILDDGSETKLYPLTNRRSKGAIPILAHYRLIDIVMSNCFNSDINKIYALSQFNSTSLSSHLSRFYPGVGPGKENFVEVLTAYQSPDDQGWFKGNADAVRKWLWVLKEHSLKEFLVLSGHHFYEMDYGEIIKAHRESGADITIAVSRRKMRHDPNVDFLVYNNQSEVPHLTLSSKREEEQYEDIGKSATEDVCGAGRMGIYVIKRDVMIKLLEKDLPEANDFGTEVIQGATSMGMKVHVYTFDGEWEDIDSIDAYYHFNMMSTRRKSSIFNLHDSQSPIFTVPQCLPPSSISHATIRDSIIGDGCILNRCRISNSVIGAQTYVGDGAVIEDSVVIGSDYYQTGERQNMATTGSSTMTVGIKEKTYIRKAIIDKNARVGRNVRIVNIDGVQECNREAHGYIISGGIVVVLRNAVIPDNSIL